MGEILDLAEALWTGKADTNRYHPLGRPRGMEQIADKTWFHRGLANTIIRETGDGLIIIDPAAGFDTEAKFEAVRSVTGQRLHTAIYTHGHNDHTFGVPKYVAEAQAAGWPLPRVIAHEAMPARFERYRTTFAWNAIINLRQFRGGLGEPAFHTDFYYPDVTYHDRMTISVGGIEARLRHARGETDDHTWIYFPDLGLLCPGDLFIWAIPNAGNPQKVQRYCLDWAAALREMAALNPDIMAPGHGVPIIGRDRVVQALTDTASFLESIHEQTVNLMNQGHSLDTIIDSVNPPEELLQKPYLQPVYDEPEFIVRNIWRWYGGWYDGMPSHLKPATERSQAEEIARLAGGAEALVRRAEELIADGNFRLACHLADWACLAEPAHDAVRAAAAEVFLARADSESSTMAMGVFVARVRELGGSPEKRLPGKTVPHMQVERAKRAKK